MSYLIAGIVGFFVLCTVVFVVLCVRAPMDTDVWPGGEPR